MEKARNAKIRIKEILSRFSLTPNLTRRIHVTAVQLIILYNAEIWWENQKSLKKNQRRYKPQGKSYHWNIKKYAYRHSISGGKPQESKGTLRHQIKEL